MFIYPVVYEVVSLAAGVFCLFFRNSTSRGLGFGILLGLGFTALLTATCAMKLTSR